MRRHIGLEYFSPRRRSGPATAILVLLAVLLGGGCGPGPGLRSSGEGSPAEPSGDGTTPAGSPAADPTAAELQRIQRLRKREESQKQQIERFEAPWVAAGRPGYEEPPPGDPSGVLVVVHTPFITAKKYDPIWVNLRLLTFARPEARVLVGDPPAAAPTVLSGPADDPEERRSRLVCAVRLAPEPTPISVAVWGRAEYAVDYKNKSWDELVTEVAHWYRPLSFSFPGAGGDGRRVVIVALGQNEPGKLVDLESSDLSRDDARVSVLEMTEEGETEESREPIEWWRRRLWEAFVLDGNAPGAGRLRELLGLDAVAAIVGDSEERRRTLARRAAEMWFETDGSWSLASAALELRQRPGSEAMRELEEMAAGLSGRKASPIARKRWVLGLVFTNVEEGRSVEVQIDTHDLEGNALCQRARTDAALAERLAAQGFRPVTRAGLPGLRSPEGAAFAWGAGGAVAVALKDAGADAGPEATEALESFLDGVRLARIIAFFSRP